MPVLLPLGASTLRRAVVQLVGIVVIATGVALTIDAELGVAPYDVVTTGMHERFGMPLGLAAVLLPLLFLAGGLALGGRVGVGTLYDIVLVGPLLGVLVALLPEVHALAVRIPMYVVGFCCITIGIVLVILPDLGAGPVEVLMLAVAGKGYRLARARAGIELVLVLVGWAMHGQVGIGTLTFAVLIGPALRHTLTWFGATPDQAATRSDAASPGA